MATYVLHMYIVVVIGRTKKLIEQKTCNIFAIGRSTYVDMTIHINSNIIIKVVTQQISVYVKRLIHLQPKKLSFYTTLYPGGIRSHDPFAPQAETMPLDHAARAINPS
jgi:hypothetical protein